MLDAHFTAVIFNIDRRLGITVIIHRVLASKLHKVFRLCLLVSTDIIYFGSKRKAMSVRMRSVPYLYLIARGRYNLVTSRARERL